MLHSYGQFTDDTRDYIISQALELVFKRDKEFIRGVEQQRNANNNAEGMVRRTVSLCRAFEIAEKARFGRIELPPAVHFGFRAEAEEVMNPEWAASASSSLLAAVPDGGGCSFQTIRYFVYHHPDCDATFTQIFRRVIPMRYRIAVSKLSFIAPWQRQPTRPVARIRVNEERETQVYDCSLYEFRPASH